jgi:hypothetical protein
MSRLCTDPALVHITLVADICWKRRDRTLMAPKDKWMRAMKGTPTKTLATGDMAESSSTRGVQYSLGSADSWVQAPNGRQGLEPDYAAILP